MKTQIQKIIQTISGKSHPNKLFGSRFCFTHDQENEKIQEKLQIKCISTPFLRFFH